MTDTILNIVFNALFAFGAIVTVYFTAMLCVEEFKK